MSFKPSGIPIAIGSFPWKDPEETQNIIFKYFYDIPLWAQLPTVDPQEQMYVQYYEGMPGITYDEAKMKLVANGVDDRFFEEMAETMSHAMEEDFEYFAITPEKARGLHYFLTQKEEISKLKPLYIKGHTTGPVSFCLTVMDSDMKPVLYDESYREAITTALACKTRWQIDKLKELYDKVIIFIDEPYLSSLGSSMVALSAEDAVSMIGGITGVIRDNGALSGVHCCGNTDWQVLFDAGCDIISFDAYEFGDNFLLYPESIASFLNKGGMIAWGIVPTSAEFTKETDESLTNKLMDLWKKLESKGISMKTIQEQSFISPSCGLGNMEEDMAVKMMEMCRKVSDRVRG
jgi:methionine synthase II (cobalamin-independent)